LLYNPEDSNLRSRRLLDEPVSLLKGCLLKEEVTKQLLSLKTRSPSQYLLYVITGFQSKLLLVFFF